MPPEKFDLAKFMQRRAKTISLGAPALIRPALGDALLELLEAGTEPSRAALVTVLEAKLKNCPSIVGDAPREQDLLRITLEQTLALLQPPLTTVAPAT